MAVMYKATTSFSGIVNMKKGDVKEINNEEVAKDLLRAGYVIELADESKTQDSKPVESKPKTTSKKTAKKAVKEDGE